MAKVARGDEKVAPVTELAFPRLGFVYDLRTDVKAPASLNVTARSGVRVEVPLHGLASDNEVHAAWFGDESECPSELTFRDHQLDLHLQGVRSTGTTTFGGHGPGVGYLRASFAVEDRDYSTASFIEVDEMRSDIELLHDFMGWKLSSTTRHSPDGTLHEVRLNTIRRDSVVLGEHGGVEVQIDPSWWAGQRDSRRSEIVERTWLRTVSRSTRLLSRHAEVHERVRDFLALICWQRVEVQDAEVQRADSPATTLDGKSVGKTWRTVHTGSLHRRREGGPRTFSFADTLSPASFDDVTLTGLQNWLSPGLSLDRVTNPLTTLLFLDGAGPEVALMQSAIAVEAMGYRMAVSDGASSHQAKELSFGQRLRLLFDASPLPVSELTTTLNDFVGVAAYTYNGLKHANRAAPDPTLCFLLAQTFCVLLRAQLLVELGVPIEAAADYSKQRQWWTLPDSFARYVAADAP